MNSLGQKKRNSRCHVLVALFSMFVLPACTQSEQPSEDESNVSIPIETVFNGEVLGCDATLNIQSHQWQLSQLAYFVSSVEVRFDTEQWHQVDFIVSDWQTSQTALVWFPRDCGQAQSLTANTQLILALSQQEWDTVTALRFELGVPFETNHQNPLTQPSPLNISEMFWSWQMGHKFVRLDMLTQSDALGTVSWSYHLGSIGCQSASKMRSPSEPCSQSNMTQHTLVNRAQSGGLRFDLSALLNNINPAEQRGCMFHHAHEVSCPVLTQNLLSNTVFTWQ